MELEPFIREDLGNGDITAELIPDVEVEAEVIAHEKGVLAGLEEAVKIFSHFGLQTSTEFKDGDRFKKGDVILRVRGSARKIVSAERISLNFLGRMSGIATLTSEFVRRAKGVTICGTRKTTPGFRKYEKKAIIIGGGHPHRYGLYDEILIKDNHIKVAGLENVLRKAKESGRKVEIEVGSVEDAVRAAELGADIIMCDNMSPRQVAKVASELKRRGLRDKVQIEVSGRVDLSNVGKYASSGADRISIGALTHSSRWIDFSLEVVQ